MGVTFGRPFKYMHASDDFEPNQGVANEIYQSLIKPVLE